MSDRLADIKKLHTAELLAGSLVEDRDWLIIEVERLRTELPRSQRGFEEMFLDLAKARLEIRKRKEAWTAAIEIDDCLRAGGNCAPGRFFDAIVLFRQHRSALEENL